MIVRDDDYSIADTAFLLDMPSRHVIALCDAGVMECSRLVANGDKKQRKRRYIAHGEIVRFNLTRAVGKQADIESRVRDPLAVQETLPFGDVEPSSSSAATIIGPVVLDVVGWGLLFAAADALGVRYPNLRKVVEKLGRRGEEVMARGLRVEGYTKEDEDGES